MSGMKRRPVSPWPAQNTNNVACADVLATHGEKTHLSLASALWTIGVTTSLSHTTLV